MWGVWQAGFRNGDFDYVMPCTSYLGYGDRVVVRVRMGLFVDYFKPKVGSTLCSMLESNTQHLWSSRADGGFISPTTPAGNTLGGSGDGWLLAYGSRGEASFWGRKKNTGGCCQLDDSDVSGWGKPYEMDVSIDGGYSVMAQETTGADADAGLVVVYDLPTTAVLGLDGTDVMGPACGDPVSWQLPTGPVAVPTLCPPGQYQATGIAANLTSVTGTRCLQKSNFRVAVNLTGSVGGTGYRFASTVPGRTGGTQCMHNNDTVGVYHWIRPALGKGALEL